MNELENALRFGATCGLKTYGEAITNWDYHYLPILPQDIVAEAVKRMNLAIKDWLLSGGKHDDLIPQNIIEEENAKLNEYFTSNKEREKG